MELTKEEAIRMHREMWDWLSENTEPDKWKTDAPVAKEYMAKHEDGLCDACFLCEYAKQLPCDEFRCENCPLIWPSEASDFMCLSSDQLDCDGLFFQWKMEDDPEKRSQLAIKIRDLPVKEG